jgi:hypothetical protein
LKAKSSSQALLGIPHQGYLKSYKSHGGFVVLTAKGSKRCGNGRVPKRVHRNQIIHHLKTLDSIEFIKQNLLKDGTAFIKHNIEPDIISDIRSKSGGATMLRQSYEDAPDATIITKDENGGESTIAVEYVSHHYSENQILAKGALLHIYGKSSVIFTANSETVAQKVERLIGVKCFAI